VFKPKYLKKKKKKEQSPDLIRLLFL
jgi:hypothetical protein